MTSALLHVTQGGEGPAVLLAHGLTATHRYVVMGSRALERSGHRVIAYDARGHGRSDPGDRYDYQSLAADMIRVLDEHGVDRAVVAGASMGAHTAIRVALDASDRVAGLVLITPAFEPERFPSGLEGWDSLARGLREGGVEGFVAAYDFGPLDPAFVDTVRTVIRQRLAAHEHPLAVADALEQVPRSAPFASFDELAAITCPTVIVGDHDKPDPGHPLRVAQLYAERIPGARLVVEEPGASPIAWQGSQLSKVIAGVAGPGDALA